MSQKNKDFYVWTMEECIKNTYEWWGIDIMSMYSHIQKNFPIATVAINNIYPNLKNYTASTQFLVFEDIRYVYEAINNLIPQHENLLFDIRTKELSPIYKSLNMCSWNQFVKIQRIDLLMAVLLFSEEFAFQLISRKNVILTDSKLTVYGNFVILKVSKHDDKTYISIRIRDVMLFEYVILN